MTVEEHFFNEVGDQMPDTIKGQLFGKPCFKNGKKAFVCFFENCMVFKLTGEVHSEALSYDGSKLFDPSGKNRPMKEWAQVPFDYQEKWKNFAKKAFEYVGNV